MPFPTVHWCLVTTTGLDMLSTIGTTVLVWTLGFQLLCASFLFSPFANSTKVAVRATYNVNLLRPNLNSPNRRGALCSQLIEFLDRQSWAKSVGRTAAAMTIVLFVVVLANFFSTSHAATNASQEVLALSQQRDVVAAFLILVLTGYV
jgi:hypothetical protein